MGTLPEVLWPGSYHLERIETLMSYKDHVSTLRWLTATTTPWERSCRCTRAPQPAGQLPLKIQCYVSPQLGAHAHPLNFLCVLSPHIRVCYRSMSHLVHDVPFTLHSEIVLTQVWRERGSSDTVIQYCTVQSTVEQSSQTTYHFYHRGIHCTKSHVRKSRAHT